VSPEKEKKKKDKKDKNKKKAEAEEEAAEEGEEKTVPRWKSVMSNINQTVTGTITGMFGCSGNNRTEDENPTIILEEGPDDIWTPPPPEEEDENMKGLPPDSKNSFVVHAISGKVAGAPSARWKEFALDSTSSWGTVPFKEAVLGGKLRNETPLYVARVKLRCGIHPASVSPPHA